MYSLHIQVRLAEWVYAPPAAAECAVRRRDEQPRSFVLCVLITILINSGVHDRAGGPTGA